MKLLRILCLNITSYGGGVARNLWRNSWRSGSLTFSRVVVRFAAGEFTKPGRNSNFTPAACSKVHPHPLSEDLLEAEQDSGDKKLEVITLSRTIGTPNDLMVEVDGLRILVQRPKPF